MTTARVSPRCRKTLALLWDEYRTATTDGFGYSWFWTPEEALAVFELIDDLRNKIGALYSDQLQALLCEQSTDPRVDDRDDTIDTLSF